MLMRHKVLTSRPRNHYLLKSKQITAVNNSQVIPDGWYLSVVCHCFSSVYFYSDLRVLFQWCMLQFVLGLSLCVIVLYVHACCIIVTW